MSKITISKSMQIPNSPVQVAFKAKPILKAKGKRFKAKACNMQPFCRSTASATWALLLMSCDFNLCWYKPPLACWHVTVPSTTRTAIWPWDCGRLIWRAKRSGCLHARIWCICICLYVYMPICLYVCLYVYVYISFVCVCALQNIKQWHDTSLCVCCHLVCILKNMKK